MWPFSKKDPFLYYPPMPFFLDLRNLIRGPRYDKLKVCNVGVGVGNSGLAVQLPYFPFGRFDNIDVHEPYLRLGKTRSYAAKEVNFIKCSAKDFDFSGYDIVLMFDVLEHLPKADSLAIMDRIKCKQIIFIPLEKEFRENNFGADSQDHLSFWTEADFKERGYLTELLPNFHKENGKQWDALWAVKEKQPCQNSQL